jgi:hypothetical protein
VLLINDLCMPVGPRRGGIAGHCRGGGGGYIDCCRRPSTVVRTPTDRQSLYVRRPKEGRDCRTVHAGGRGGYIDCCRLLADDLCTSVPSTDNLCTSVFAMACLAKQYAPVRHTIAHLLLAPGLEGVIYSYDDLISPLNALNGDVGHCVDKYALINEPLLRKAFVQKGYSSSNFTLQYSLMNITVVDANEEQFLIVNKI